VVVLSLGSGAIAQTPVYPGAKPTPATLSPMMGAPTPTPLTATTSAETLANQAEVQRLQEQLKGMQDKLGDMSSRYEQQLKSVQETQTIVQSLQSTTEKKFGEVKSSTELSINISWTLITGFLVMFMQAGFAMVETGLTRYKNVAHTMAMNFMVYALGMLGFWVCGFALQFGGTGAATSVSTVGSLGEMVKTVLNGEIGFSMGDKFFGLMGTKGFFLMGPSFDAGIFTLFLFQMVFMDTTATIPTGTMAERWKFSAFAIYGFLVGALIYPIYANWVWGGGWLAALGKNFHLGHGHVDFAGSSVVHLVGGILALVGGKMIGPRLGKFNADGTPNPIPGHNLPMAIIGTFILAFGWFGFNPGSTLSAMDTQIGIIATNTMLASAAGAVVAMLITWWRFGKPEPSFMCNGMLAGLVAITAPCAFVEAWAAVLIGAVAGVLVYASVFFVEETLRIDDPVGAISVHGANGVWGVISLGLLANGKYGDAWNGVDGKVTGLFYGDSSQLVAQCVGVTACFLYVGAAGWLTFTLLESVVGNRVTAEAEIEGLDGPEMGVAGYLNSDITPGS
jgi:Amt family ammonium transporter